MDGGESMTTEEKATFVQCPLQPCVNRVFGGQIVFPHQPLPLQACVNSASRPNHIYFRLGHSQRSIIPATRFRVWRSLPSCWNSRRNAEAVVAERSEAEAERSKAMASSSPVPVGSTHKQHKQELVAADGGAAAVASVAVASPAPAPAPPPPLGSKLAVNKKRAVHHAKGNSSSNSKAAADATIKSLRAQVQRLEKQRQFLTSWRPEALLGVDAEAAFVDVELKAGDGLSVYAHKSVLVVRSKDFETLLLMDPSTKVIEVPEMTGDQLRVFVSFFYTGEISANDLLHHTTAFLLAADKYKVPYLGAVCEDALIANLSRQNAITTFDIVKNHCSDATKEAVLKKAMKMGELSQYEEYKLYTTKNPALLLELYEQLSEPIESTPTKKHRVAPENGTVENDTNNSDGAEDESGSNEGVEEDHKVDMKEMKQEGENEVTLGGTAPINGSSPFGGSGGGVVYWHSGPPRPPQHGQTFPLGYNKGVYNQGHRPPFYGQLVPGPPFAVPPFIPAMYPSGSLPRDLAGAALPGSPGQAERPPSTTEEHIVQGKPKRKKLSKHQAKVEGRRGWTTAEVEALISLRGQMDEEFDRNKQKQGVNTWSKLHQRMTSVVPGFCKTVNACRKKYALLYNDYRRYRKSIKNGTPDTATKNKKVAIFEQMDRWRLRHRVKADASAGDTTDSPGSSGDEG